jgi:hypothetical protein
VIGTVSDDVTIIAAGADLKKIENVLSHELYSVAKFMVVC